VSAAPLYVDHTRGNADAALKGSNINWAKKTVQGARGVDLLLMSRYKKTIEKDGFLSANQELRESVGRLNCQGDVNRSAAMSIDDIRNLAEWRAEMVVKLCSRVRNREPSEFGFTVKSFCGSVGVEFPCKLLKKDSQEDIRRKIMAAVLRCSDAKWWRRRITVLNRRQVEAEMIRMGEVGAEGKPYVSNWGFKRIEMERAAAEKMMQQIKIVRQSDQLELQLSDVSKGTVANPAVRLSETIIRAKGLEDCAQEAGMVGLFFTLTCPSRFHARPTNARGISDKWAANGEPSPRDATLYLRTVWARIRARWAKAGIGVMGFRVAEPHKDGCPHYHMLVFCKWEDCQLAERIFAECALKDSPGERGAAKYRWKCIKIDSAQGSAVGYLMKYLAKGLTGEGVADDLDTGSEVEQTGISGIDAALRVRAWASIWGCRQFQFFGCASVTAWRELRRVSEPVESEKIEEARLLADSSRFGEYMRHALSAKIKALSMSSISKKYGDLVSRVVGVWVDGLPSSILTTRRDIWELRSAWEPRERSPVTWLDRCAGAVALAGLSLSENWGKSHAQGKVVASD
jgi:hypothetical protein